MTAIVESISPSGIFQGRPAHIRFWAYIGLMVGALLLAFFGGKGYDEDNYLFRLLSMQGLLWCGAGAVLGAIVAAVKNDLAATFAEATVPWLDGAVVMLALMAVFTLFEPHPSMISYEDQSNLVSGRIIMAMNLFFLFSAVCYIVHLFAPESFIGRMATLAAWGGVYTGGSALLLRWYESYLLLGGDIGHAPVSNLYEVFILLFCITSCIYLAFERRYQAKAMGAFIMTIVAAGVFFGIWLDSIGQADIKPLVPALQSYWMKIHVPLNFIGYGSFAVACGAGMFFLGRNHMEESGKSWGMALAVSAVPGAILGYWVAKEVGIFLELSGMGGMLVKAVALIASIALISWGLKFIIESKGDSFLKSFPSLEALDGMAYKSVAVGFPAFTLATILGAAWAAEAWGGYWSWDPKETWALIVWLFYGAYLHVRISHGWSGKTLAWWAVAGFFVTLFCFVGVNMYLSGLHSYGRLA